MKLSHEVIKFKHEKDKDLIFCVHPIMNMILFDVAAFCDKFFYKLTVTATRTDRNIDRIQNRKSSTHRTGRAVDLRTRDMPETIKKDLIKYLNDKYFIYAAVTTAGKNVLVVDKSDHLHLQIHSRYALKEFLIEEK